MNQRTLKVCKWTFAIACFGTTLMLVYGDVRRPPPEDQLITITGRVSSVEVWYPATRTGFSGTVRRMRISLDNGAGEYIYVENQPNFEKVMQIKNGDNVVMLVDTFFVSALFPSMCFEIYTITCNERVLSTYSENVAAIFHGGSLCFGTLLTLIGIAALFVTR